MDFLKKHYEKILLSVVLLGLVVAVGFLPVKIAADKQELEDKKVSLLKPHVQPLTNLDMTLPEAALKLVATPAVVTFSDANQRLFNPMPWQQSADGRLIPAKKVGPNSVVVSDITPLYLILTLDAITPMEGGVRYTVGIEKPPVYGTRHTKAQTTCTLNPPTKNRTFGVVDVKGKPENPQLILQMSDTGEQVVLTTNQPFKRVEGYVADLRYEPENKSWSNRRVGAILPLNGEGYRIVAINKNEVVLSAPNQKKWTIKYNPNATP